ncbi:hypothetical protein DM860_012663 [Cuscuta australis]|uniref:Fe2OG dioxygenase domain-containing protein n=1 Tax=Cuscuta australis TaxID=267555 RepID=A0A328DCF7_9ASTE|nr:hypothetical protein DM860_012663 [Cuscuta australis]
MPPAAGPVAHHQPNNRPMLMGNVVSPVAHPNPAVVSDSFAKDAVIAWFRGEFAAANAIIDALCNHLTQLEGGGAGSEYESAFTAIHRRRLNWIPILQMQKYYSIADVALELRKVAARKEEVAVAREAAVSVVSEMNAAVSHASREEAVEDTGKGGSEAVSEDLVRDDSHGSPESEITDSGSQDVQPVQEDIEFCSRHENCEERRSLFKMTKGFMGREPVKGHMVNVVRGLKLYEDIFSPIELSKLSDFVNQLRVAGRNGELSGETFILYNQQLKGNKRELVQLGTPIFGHVKEDLASPKSSNEPIPALLELVIDHLIQWHLISENRRPNGCIINFFDEVGITEIYSVYMYMRHSSSYPNRSLINNTYVLIQGEYSQPFLKPPHLEQPISTLLLSESTMAFGRSLVSDSDGNYRASLVLPLKEGSLLIMRGNSADMARHAMCSSSNKRVSITFFKIRTCGSDVDSHYRSSSSNEQVVPLPPLTKAMTLWQPAAPLPPSYTSPNLNYDTSTSTMDLIIPKTLIRPPVVMLAPVVHPLLLSPGRKLPGCGGGGTGVFLPWTAVQTARRHVKHLPPRALKRRFHLALPPSPVEPETDPASEPSIDDDLAYGNEP